MLSAFKDVLRAELTRRGQNQQWLARELGVSHVTVSLWLSGKRDPSAERVAQVAAALGLATSEFYALMEEHAAQAAAQAVPVLAENQGGEAA